MSSNVFNIFRPYSQGGAVREKTSTAARRQADSIFSCLGAVSFDGFEIFLVIIHSDNSLDHDTE